jgi:HlyD family secretion protein
MIVLVLLAAIGAGAWYYTHRGNDAPQYQTVAVTRGELTQVVTATGQINPVTNVTVGSQISGILAKVYVDFNSKVTNGQVLAQIDPSTYQANLLQAQADLANAKASLELAQVNARRAQELFNNELIPQSDLDTATANLHQAEAAVLNRQASLSRVTVDLGRCTIYSPVDGIVISRSVDVGQTVAASLSAPTLFVIANDLTKMQIDANVSEADVGGVEVGQNVDFTVDAFPYRTFHGTVTQVRNAPLTVQNVVTYDSVIGVNNDDLRLKPGMTANVSIIIARRDDAFKIPNAALRFRPPDAGTNTVARFGGSGGPPGGGSGGGRNRGERRSARTVYVLKDNKPQPVPIKTGITDGIQTEITEGLSETDKVISSVITKQTTATPAANPFGGGMQRRF